MSKTTFKRWHTCGGIGEGGISLFHQGQLRTSVEWACRNHVTWCCLQFLVCPLREVSCQATVVACKPPVEIGKPQELLQLLQVRGYWPLSDGCDLVSICTCTRKTLAAGEYWGSGRKSECHPGKQTKCSIISLDTLLIRAWKTVRALVRPNGLIEFTKCPSGVLKSFFHSSPSEMWTRWYAFQRSSLEKILASWRGEKAESIGGKGYLFLTVILCNP